MTKMWNRGSEGPARRPWRGSAGAKLVSAGTTLVSVGIEPFSVFSDCGVSASSCDKAALLLFSNLPDPDLGFIAPSELVDIPALPTQMIHDR